MSSRDHKRWLAAYSFLAAAFLVSVVFQGPVQAGIGQIRGVVVQVLGDLGYGGSASSPSLGNGALTVSNDGTSTTLEVPAGDHLDAAEDGTTFFRVENNAAGTYLYSHNSAFYLRNLAGGGASLNLVSVLPTADGFYSCGNASLRWAVVATDSVNMEGGVLVRSGSGSPESAVTAPVGSLYLRSDGGASTTLYVKESGAGNTGWVAK